MTVRFDIFRGRRLRVFAGDGDVLKLDIPLKEAKELRRWLNENYHLLRPEKDWDNCSYEHHADDCDCRGVGGDR